MFSKRQQFELITAIQGRGEIPLKFAYLGEGSKHREAIVERRLHESGVNRQEKEVLEKKISNFLSIHDGVSTINIVDIGCGDGRPVFPLLKELVQKNIKYKYIAIDISASMIAMARENVEKEFPCETEGVELDFELGNFSDITYKLKGEKAQNLLCFLGTTLGNFSDQRRVLSNFRDSMGANDYLLLGVELTNIVKEQQILDHYKGDIIIDFLGYIPKYIGITQEKIRYLSTRNDKDNQVEIRMILQDDVTVVIGESQFLLKKNEQILLARSTKFDEKKIVSILSDAGLRNELLTTSENRGYLVAMVQPTRYYS